MRGCAVADVFGRRAVCLCQAAPQNAQHYVPQLLTPVGLSQRGAERVAKDVPEAAYSPSGLRPHQALAPPQLMAFLCVCQ